MKPRIVQVPRKVIAGKNIRTRNANESDPEMNLIKGLWGNFFQQNQTETIPDQVENSQIHGVYHNFESDVNGEYTLTAGKEVRPDSPVSEEYPRIEIQAGDYLLFENSGKMPEAFFEAWQQVWKYFEDQPEYERAYKSDFEVYVSNSEVAIYIGVK